LWGSLISLARAGKTKICNRVFLLGTFPILPRSRKPTQPHRELDYDVPPGSELWLINRVRGMDTTDSLPCHRDTSQAEHLFTAFSVARLGLHRVLKEANSMP
jgi:hypothetical protein